MPFLSGCARRGKYLPWLMPLLTYSLGCIYSLSVSKYRKERARSHFQFERARAPRAGPTISSFIQRSGAPLVDEAYMDTVGKLNSTRARSHQKQSATGLPVTPGRTSRTRQQVLLERWTHDDTI